MSEQINSMLETKIGLSLCWTGNDGWLLGAQQHLIAFDLDFCSEERISPPPLPLSDVATALDWLLITHNHGDHLNGDTCRYLVEHSNCRFLLPESCRPQQEDLRLPIERVRFVAPGMELALEPWLNVKTIRAIHGHKLLSVYEHANLLDCGFIIAFNGRTVFQPGDSVLLQQHLELAPVDVLMVSPTEHNTHIEGSLAMIGSIRPKTIIAQHFGTYHVTADNAFWTRGYPDELLQALPAEDRGKFIKPEQGSLIYI
jgi:L-ascorbate 6-phosphate lactonase